MNMTTRFPPLDRSALLADLRSQVAGLEHVGSRRGREAAVPLCPSLDQALPAGGLARAALHEVLAVGELGGPALGFVALALARSRGTVLWIAPEPEAWPPGLLRFGLDPDRLLLVRATRQADALWAMEEALRCHAVSAALLFSPGISLTAGRRLMLAAESGGALGILLRADSTAPGPAVALTRWRIAPLPALEPEHPRWQVELLRSRGGAGGHWSLCWRENEGVLEDEAFAPSPIRRSRVG